MVRALAAGCAYFAAVFAAGVLLGILRRLLLERAIGDVAATLVELPFILVFSWVACAFAIKLCRVRRAIWDRSVMGGAAFALLMSAEQALGSLMGVSEPLLLRLANPAQLLGFVGQILFAAMPLLRLALYGDHATESEGPPPWTSSKR
jgi:hypothetical protein